MALRSRHTPVRLALWLFCLIAPVLTLPADPTFNPEDGPEPSIGEEENVFRPPFGLRVTPQKFNSDGKQNITVTTTRHKGGIPFVKIELPLSIIRRLKGPSLEEAVLAGQLSALLGDGYWVSPAWAENAVPDDHILRFYPIDAPIPKITLKSGPLDIWEGFLPGMRQRQLRLTYDIYRILSPGTFLDIRTYLREQSTNPGGGAASQEDGVCSGKLKDLAIPND